MYDETIQRSARRLKIEPLIFEHPYHDRIRACFDQRTTDPVSVILTGTAGDGKTHLCRQVWKVLEGDESKWEEDNPYLSLTYHYPKDRTTWPDSREPEFYRKITIHFIRDLSGWAPQQGAEWEPEKEELLQKFCRSLFDEEADEVFLIAANDGQLVESWRRLRQTDAVVRAQQVFEELLVEDRNQQEGVRLKFFNLSRASSARLFDLAVKEFLIHSGWSDLKFSEAGENEVFGPKCPIRRNYELLSTDLVQSRIRALLELCDYNGLHVPIRQILLLLANAILGHPDVKDRLMRPRDVPKVIADGTASKASIYGNVFGANLSDIRRRTITIFDYLERFQIGNETTNRIDNLLIFGEDDKTLGDYFKRFIGDDEFYGADSRFYGAKREYVEGTDESDDRANEFLEMLIHQRRALFFKVPKEEEEELKLWELTVFQFAGEYLADVVDVLRGGGTVKRPILWRLVKGLNRVFTGMLVNEDKTLILATSGNFSQSRVSRILLDRVSVDPSKGEKVTLKFDESNGNIVLTVYFTRELTVDFELTLIRYEFLSRIAEEGALPSSFSKECYEDFLAFKSQLIAGLREREDEDQPDDESAIRFDLLSLTDQGMPYPHPVEIVQP